MTVIDELLARLHDAAQRRPSNENTFRMPARDRLTNTVFDTGDQARIRAFTALPTQSFHERRDGLKWRIDQTSADGTSRTLPIGRFWLWWTARRIAGALATAHNDGAWIGMPDTETITLAGRIVNQHNTAIEFRTGLKTVWLPRDRVTIARDGTEVTLRIDLAVEKGLMGGD